MKRYACVRDTKLFTPGVSRSSRARYDVSKISYDYQDLNAIISGDALMPKIGT
jgi:hypothetical protein